MNKLLTFLALTFALNVSARTHFGTLASNLKQEFVLAMLRAARPAHLVAGEGALHDCVARVAP